MNYYLTDRGYFYSNRLALFLEKKNVIDDIKDRIETYFDTFVIDEVQDFAGRDFNFIETLMKTKVEMLFVGDFYQHTFDTSRDGNVNNKLFDDYKNYEKRFIDKGFISDSKTLQGSWRCSKEICDYVSANLGILISSNVNDFTGTVCFVDDKNQILSLINNQDIIKLHYQKSSKYGRGHKNWGDTKGEDCYQDVCVMLNKKTMDHYKKGTLLALAPSTKNKLYVAITRARGNVFLVEERIGLLV